jgi:hypothetical protein
MCLYVVSAGNEHVVMVRLNIHIKPRVVTVEDSIVVNGALISRSFRSFLQKSRKRRTLKVVSSAT